MSGNDDWADAAVYMADTWRRESARYSSQPQLQNLPRDEEQTRPSNCYVCLKPGGERRTRPIEHADIYNPLPRRTYTTPPLCSSCHEWLRKTK